MSASETYQCPYCGGEVAVGDQCAGCARNQGKQRQPPPAGPKSWEQDEVHDALDLPDEDFDYDEFVAREFGRTPHRKLGVRWYWWALALGMLLLVLGLIATNRWWYGD